MKAKLTKVWPRLGLLMVAVVVLLLSLAAFATVTVPEADASSDAAAIGSGVEASVPVDAQDQPDDGEQRNESGGGLGWLIAVLLLAGIAGVVGFGALRLRRRL